MTHLTRSAAAVLSFTLLLGHSAATAQAVPSGWRTAATTGAGIERAYQASGLPAGQYLTIEQGVLQPRSGASIDGWLSAVISNDPSPEGTWGPQPRPTNVNADLMATVAREFQATPIRRGGRIYLGVVGADDKARVLRLTFSSAEALKSSQGAAARELMSALAQQSIAGRRQGVVAARGTSPAAVEPASAPPPSRAGFRAGGPIQPGRYTGVMVNNDGKVIVRYDVTIFANGEYAAPSGDNLLDSTGTYTYAAGTGRLDIDGKLYNNTYRPDEDFCLFGRDATGNAAIYVEDYYGIGTFRALLRRVGDPTREPPSVVLAARKAAEAEAKRYKFVTAPGAGLRESQIEAVYYEWKQVFEIGGLQFKEYVYLLLKDGTVRNGLPVPPQDLDVAASRRAEPEEWGRWRRVGAHYEFAFGAGDTFSRKQGHTVLPARAGQTLLGKFEGNSYFQIPGGASAWSKFGVTFSAGGRFEKFRWGGAGMSGGYGDQRVVTASVYDDDGAVGGVSSASVSASSSTRTPDTGNRRGTYRVEGFAIILTYENGTVERLPFAIQQGAAGQVDGVWMTDFMLTPPKK